VRDSHDPQLTTAKRRDTLKTLLLPRAARVLGNLESGWPWDPWGFLWMRVTSFQHKMLYPACAGEHLRPVKARRESFLPAGEIL
jgi:hypothetical protein